jgi:hypothetical protein
MPHSPKSGTTSSNTTEVDRNSDCDVIQHHLRRSCHTIALTMLKKNAGAMSMNRRENLVAKSSLFSCLLRTWQPQSSKLQPCYWGWSPAPSW